MLKRIDTYSEMIFTPHGLMTCSKLDGYNIMNYACNEAKLPISDISLQVCFTVSLNKILS